MWEKNVIPANFHEKSLFLHQRSRLLGSLHSMLYEEDLHHLSHLSFNEDKSLSMKKKIGIKYQDCINFENQRIES